MTSGDEFQTNAGSATSYGAEFEIRGRITDALTADLSGSVLNATLDHGVNVNGVLVNGTFAGEKIPGVPDFNLTADMKYSFQLSDDDQRLCHDRAELGGRKPWGRGHQQS